MKIIAWLRLTYFHDRSLEPLAEKVDGQTREANAQLGHLVTEIKKFRSRRRVGRGNLDGLFDEALDVLKRGEDT